jgi:uncharacterized protein (DUF2344 family)
MNAANVWPNPKVSSVATVSTFETTSAFRRPIRSLTYPVGTSPSVHPAMNMASVVPT